MNRILLNSLLMTLIAVFVLVTTALADETDDITGTSTVTVNLPIVFRADFVALSSPTIQVLEADIIQNTSATVRYMPTPGGSITYSTNLQPTRWKVKRSNFSTTPPGLLGAAFQLRLRINLTGGNGINSGVPINQFGNTPNGQAVTNVDQDCINIPNGDAQRVANMNYGLSGVTIGAEPGAYATTVTYTMYKP